LHQPAEKGTFWKEAGEDSGKVAGIGQRKNALYNN
jgi:hypothetical protein